MDVNKTVDGVKNDIKNVKTLKDVKWYMPFAAAVLLCVLFFTDVAVLTWLAMLGSAALSVWAFIEQVANKKESPVKIDWYWLLLVAVLVGVFLYKPGITWIVIAGLLVWGGIMTYQKFFSKE